MHANPEALENFAKFIEQKLGMRFSKLEELKNRLTPFAKELGYPDINSCLIDLTSRQLSPQEINTLIETLTIGETYFFRDAFYFKHLEEHILPRIIQSKKNHEIKIWSAATATGEEAYSIAILLDQLLPNRREWKIKIIATDINIKFLERAKTGHYKNWSFRATPKEIKEKYFHHKGHVSIIKDEIKQMVDFRYLNLAEDFFPNYEMGIHDVDLIICNNVLIYFSERQINAIVTKLTDSLEENGWLCVTAIEAPFIKDPRLTLVSFDRALFFQKGKKPQEKKVTPRLVPKIMKKSPHIKPIMRVAKNATKQTKKSQENAITENHDQPIENLAKQLSDLSDEQLKTRVKDLFLLIQSYADRGLLELAEQWSVKALSIDSLDPELYCLYATILEEQGALEKAFEILKKALFLNPNFTIAYYSLGNLAVKMGRTKEAERYFRNALKLLEGCQDEDLVGGISAAQIKEAILKATK